MPALLHIKSVPPGEAPLWVREQWVGLLLPLAQRKSTPVSFLTFGVLSGPKGFLSCIAALVSGKMVRQSGYAIEALAAVSLLEGRSPEAAAWWRASTPHLMRKGRFFVFDGSVGDVVHSEPAA